MAPAIHQYLTTKNSNLMKRNEKIQALLLKAGDKKMLGVIGLNNVTVIDKPFSEANNSIADILRSIDSYSYQWPVVCDPVVAAVPTAGQIVLFGPDVTAADLVAPIRFSTAVFNLLATKFLSVIGYMVTQRFTQNTVSSQYSMLVRNYFAEGPGPAIYRPADRDSVIIPEGGANSVTEFFMFNMIPSGQFPYNATTRTFDAPLQQNQGFIAPLPFGNQQGATNQNLGLITSAALIFKDQAGISQNISVLPVIAHQQSTEMIADLIASRIS